MAEDGAEDGEPVEDGHGDGARGEDADVEGAVATLVEAVLRVAMVGVDDDRVASLLQADGGVYDQSLRAADAEIWVEEDKSACLVVIVALLLLVVVVGEGFESVSFTSASTAFDGRLAGHFFLREGSARKEDGRSGGERFREREASRSAVWRKQTVGLSQSRTKIERTQ